MITSRNNSVFDCSVFEKSYVNNKTQTFHQAIEWKNEKAGVLK